MQTRVISAVVVVALLVAIFLIWRVQGLYVICGLIGIGSAMEYSRVAFRKLDPPMHIRFAYFLFSAILFGVTSALELGAVAAFASVLSVGFITMVLLTIRSTEDLAEALQIQAIGILGLLYCGLYTGLAVRLLGLPNGHIWLFGLMGIVFSGDTFAYLAGRSFGRRKLLEPVSPKKTIEGSLGGLAGSAAAGAVLGLFFLPQVPLWAVILMALITGAFAQVGDLFESLLKRVAEVKDSGAIMPGHGGILDRIDGVLFAAPVYFVLVKFLT